MVVLLYMTFSLFFVSQVPLLLVTVTAGMDDFVAAAALLLVRVSLGLSGFVPFWGSLQ